jgi:hypothetical protein
MSSMTLLMGFTLDLKDRQILGVAVANEHVSTSKLGGAWSED